MRPTTRSAESFSRLAHEARCAMINTRRASPAAKRVSACSLALLLPVVCAACCGEPARNTSTALDRPSRVTYAADAVGGSPAPKTQPASDLLDKETPPAAHWAFLAKAFNKPGVEHDGVYTVTIPRDDWDVNIEGMPVPTAAGLASVFHFYRCPCGKTNVVGAFCVADYEVNDVIDALRAAHVQVVSIAPMLLYTRANPQIVRFQAESQTEPLSKALREALRWTGKERLAPEAPAPAAKP